MSEAEFKGKLFAIAIAALVCWGALYFLAYGLYAAGKWLHLW